MTSIRADLGEYLQEQRHSAKLSLRQLAALAGVSNPYLSQIERGLKKPSAEILQQLAKGLRISAESLYVRAGILDEQEPSQVEVKTAIFGDLGLSERQKRVLLDIYASFCAENERAATTEGPATPPARATSRTGTKKATTRKSAAKKSAKQPAQKAATARTTRRTTTRSSS